MPDTTESRSESAPFDWASRVSESVLELPFIEGMPTMHKAQEMNRWIRAHSDRYANKLVKLYHATDPALPIATEGLRPTSTPRRRSYQSRSGYVYLAATPARADMFGRLGNSGRSAVYEVLVRVRHLRADTDQLNNQRAVGQDVGNTVGESIVFGGGACVKGGIEPWAIRKLEGFVS